MSTEQASAANGGYDLAPMRRGHKRWQRRQVVEKRRELKRQLTALQRRERDLARRYEASFEKACRSESRGAAAVAAAFDEADRLMNGLMSARTEIRQAEAKLRSAP